MKDALGQPQSVLVLGGTSDIALAIVKELAKRRTHLVILAGRHVSSLEAAASEIRAAGVPEVHLLEWDATNVSDHSVVLGEAFQRHGPIDLVLVAAGALGDQRRDELDPTSAHFVMTTNYSGLAPAMLVASQHLQSQGQGTLVVLSSVAGVRVRKSNFIYGSSKAAIDSFSQGLADSLVGTGVEVIIVRPGFVRSKMTHGMKAAPFSTDPAAVASATVAALAKSVRFVWVPGTLKWVFAIMRVLPRSIFRRIPG